MPLRRVVSIASLLLASACADIVVGGGEPCGGTRQVDAQVVLPDTGVGAGGQGSLGFVEAEPNGSRDEASLFIWLFPLADAPFAGSPPRMRLVTDDGRVFLDQQSTSAAFGSWYARQAVSPGPVRDEIVSAFQAGLVLLELSSVDPGQKVTRITVRVRFAGRTPVATCL